MQARRAISTKRNVAKNQEQIHRDERDAKEAVQQRKYTKTMEWLDGGE